MVEKIKTDVDYFWFQNLKKVFDIYCNLLSVNVEVMMSLNFGDDIYSP